MRIIPALLLSILLVACSKNQKPINEVDKIIAEVKRSFAPDKRVAIFDIQSAYKNDSLILTGESNLPNAVDSLISRLQAITPQIKNEIDRLTPYEAIVNISVANLRSKPKHSAELATQALLGMSLKVYKEKNGWYLVQTPDNYIAWTDADAFTPFTSENELNQYLARPKVVFTSRQGFVYDENGTISDIVFGGLLSMKDETASHYKVQFPDGRNGLLKKEEAMKYEDWLTTFERDTSNLVKSAKSLLGLPYLWGGTSTKGVDCSGFTKTVYLMNGLILARDASQQVNTGVLVDESKNFRQLEAGDLLFFGRAKTDSTKERVTHVGMWIGNTQFIHSAGKVKINSMNPQDSLFDKGRYDTYLRSKRMIAKHAPGVTVVQ